jgi:hypothetical protein
MPDLPEGHFVPDEAAEPPNPLDPNVAADVTAEAFGDGFPPARVADVDEQTELPLDQLTDQIQGPDLEHPQDTFRPDTLLNG